MPLQVPSAWDCSAARLELGAFWLGGAAADTGHLQQFVRAVPPFLRRCQCHEDPPQSAKWMMWEAADGAVDGAIARMNAPTSS